MIVLKLLVAWWLFGGITQLAMYIEARMRYGRFAADQAIRIGLGGFPIAKVALASLLWPVGAITFIAIRLDTPEKRARARAKVDAYNKSLEDRCPDCGELLTEHEHEEES